MKRLILTFSLLSFITFNLFAQFEADSLATEEYAIVKVRVYFQGGGIVKPTSVHPNPTVSYQGINEGKFTIPFKNVFEVMNYMNRYGWKYINSNVIEYLGDGGNNSAGTVINTNEYLQILYFKRELKSKTAKL